MLNFYLKHIVDYAKGFMTTDMARNVSLAFVAVLAISVFLLPESALAAGSEKVNDTICNIVEELQGPVARGVAAFGIIFLGFSLFLGKISWGVALALGIGIGAIFGANEIVGLLGDGTDACESFDDRT